MWFCENHCGLDGFASICRTTFLLLLLGMEGEGEGGWGEEEFVFSCSHYGAAGVTLAVLC